MGRVRASARKEIDAAPDAVYEVLTDYATHHPRIMPASYFSDLEVESGGVGAGTVFHITLRVPGRDQRLHMKVDEPTPGRVLTETNLDTGVVTRFSVEPVDGGERTMAAMSSDMPTGAGLRGLVDRWMLPRMTRHIFEQQLEQLARYMRSPDAPT